MSLKQTNFLENLFLDDPTWSTRTISKKLFMVLNIFSSPLLKTGRVWSINSSFFIRRLYFGSTDFNWHKRCIYSFIIEKASEILRLPRRKIYKWGYDRKSKNLSFEQIDTHIIEGEHKP